MSTFVHSNLSFILPLEQRLSQTFSRFSIFSFERLLLFTCLFKQDN